MANVRIKDLTTTAATTASDDFFGVDGATNGTRKLNAYSPTFGGNLTVSGITTGTQSANNGTLRFNSVNTSAGTAAVSGYLITGDTNVTALQQYSTGYVSSGINIQNSAVLYTNSAGLNLCADNASGAIGFYTGGQNLRLSISSTGNATLAGNLTVSGTASSFGGFSNAGGAVYVRKDSGEVFRADAAGAGYRIVADQNGVDLGGARTTVGGNLTVNGTGTNYFVGDITSTATGNNQWQITKGAATNYATLAFSETTSGAAWAIGQRTTAAAGGANRFSFYGSGVGGDAMQITYLGNVLIGTTADGGQKLQVSGTAAISGNLSSGARITAGNGFTATSTVPTVLAASTNLDYNSGTSKGRLFIWGPDSGTIAGFEIKLANSTNSSIIDAVSFDSSGNATFAGTGTFSGASLTLSNSTDPRLRVVATGSTTAGLFLSPNNNGGGWTVAAAASATPDLIVYDPTAGGTEKFRIYYSTGNIENTGSIKTAAPSGGTAGAWKLGVRVAATTTLDTTQYLQVDIGGTLYKVALVTS